ncbi:MAG: NifB/NifX family molybdenum-iron cluster-binding protein [Syntrophobacteraceae bacterium]
MTMKIAVSAVQPNLDSEVDPRFGRCAFFILIDSETMEWEGVENRDAMAAAAGISAAKFVADQGARAVITGVVGPQATETLNAAGIEIFTVPGGSVKAAVEAFNTGRLQTGRQSSPPAQAGQGRPGQGQAGQGRCMGGGGRGMGRGMGPGKTSR